MSKVRSGDVTVPITGVSAKGRVGSVGSVGATALHQTLTKDWEAIYRLGRTARGVLTVVGLEVRPAQNVPDDGLTIAVIRLIAIGRARRYVNNQARFEAQRQPSAPSSTGPPRGRTPRLTHQDYGKLLKRYDGLVDMGDPHPAKTLFEDLKREGVTKSRSTVRTWLLRAREKAKGL
jgi:hypothetical protein